ncbi:MAG: hypothetical protein GY845_32565 [Planctomycetes bacterium]|nr:hypothetical protein [Planctomycetota bacterium]
MPFTIIRSAEARYLAASDILIGDMSDTNYEFLLFNRPIILLANQWLSENFPDIGIKTDLKGLAQAISQNIQLPEAFERARHKWLEDTIYLPDGKSSQRILEAAVEHARIIKPVIVIVHDDCSVKKTNLLPLYKEALARKLKVKFVASAARKHKHAERCIFFAAHFYNLMIPYGYKVHLDHGLKGKGTANVEMSIADYKKNNYFNDIQLHITAGKVGHQRTQMLLGPNKERAVIAGYPKADDLINSNTPQNRQTICKELNFNPQKPIITYASAGSLSHEKPGGSFAPCVIDYLQELSGKYNIMIKEKYSDKSFLERAVSKIKRIVRIF